MAENTALNIRFIVEDSSYDLRIPRMVKVEALKEILRDALTSLRVVLPLQFDFEVVNKFVTLEDSVLVHHYPLSDGDELKLVERKESHD